MRCCILAVLFLAVAVSWAQPLQGPSVLFAIPDSVTVEHLFVTVREDSMADLFYQLGNSVFHAAASLESGALIVDPQALPGPDTGWGRLLCGAVWSGSDMGWSELVHDTTATGNVTRVFHGFDAPDTAVVIDSSEDWYSGDWFNTSRNSCLTLADRFGGGFIAAWVDDWQVGDPWHQEGGISLYSRICSPHAAECLTPCFYSWSGDAPLIHSVSDSLVLMLSVQYGVLVLDTLHPLVAPGFPPNEYSGANNLVEFLAMPNGRLFAISCASGTTLFELQDGQSYARISQNTPPAATAKHRNWGLAWLMWGDDGLYLTRADTSGALHQLAGEVDRPPTANDLLAAAMAIHTDGRVVMLWLEYEAGESPARLLKLASVGWDTPLAIPQSSVSLSPSSFAWSAYPNPFNSELRIDFVLPQSGEVELAAYNLLGQRVAVIQTGRQAAGAHVARWSPTMAGGVYFIALRTAEATRATKVLYLK